MRSGRLERVVFGVYIGAERGAWGCGISSIPRASAGGCVRVLIQREDREVGGDSGGALLQRALRVSERERRGAKVLGRWPWAELASG